MHVCVDVRVHSVRTFSMNELEGGQLLTTAWLRLHFQLKFHLVTRVVHFPLESSYCTRKQRSHYCAGDEFMNGNKGSWPLEIKECHYNSVMKFVTACVTGCKKL